MMNHLLLSFIPLFVAVDVIGVLPIFVSLTEGLEKRRRNKIIFQSLATALCLAIGFLFLGKATFRFLGITVNDFMIAGGAILFCIAVIDLVIPGKQRRIPEEDVGVVPIGTPLIVGPAVLTTSLMLINEYGLAVTAAAVILNLVIVGVVFLCSDGLIRLLGTSGSRALSKIMALFLAAIAVMMIRKGIVQLIQGF